MKTKLLFLIILFLVFVLVFAKFASDVTNRRHFSEQPIQPLLSSPIASTAQLETISISNVSKINELSTASHNNNGGAVIAFSESSDPDILQTVYENGVFTQWDMKSQRVVKSQMVFSLVLDNLPIYQLNNTFANY